MNNEVSSIKRYTLGKTPFSSPLQQMPSHHVGMGSQDLCHRSDASPKASHRVAYDTSCTLAMFATSPPFRGLSLHHPRRVVSPFLQASRRRHRRRRCTIRQPTTISANRYQTSVEVPTTATPIVTNNALFWVVLVAQVQVSSVAVRDENLV